MRVEEPREECKRIGGHVLECKEGQREGVPVGFITGYIATWDLDEGLDRFVRGAFLKAIELHKSRPTHISPEGRPVRLKNQHRNLVGGWPIEGISEDAKGLLGTNGEINLEVQEGRELWSNLKAGYITDLSVGFGAREFKFEDEGMVRIITESDLWEGSPVDEPMNRAATIGSIKARFRDLEVAGKEVEWTGYKGDDRRAYLAGNDKAFAQMVGDDLVVVQSRLSVLAEELIAKGKAASAPQVATLEGYFAKCGLPSPFPAEMRGYFRTDEVAAMSQRQIQGALTQSGAFSKGAARLLADRVNSGGGEAAYIAKMLKSIRDSTAALQTL